MALTPPPPLAFFSPEFQSWSSSPPPSRQGTWNSLGQALDPWAHDRLTLPMGLTSFPPLNAQRLGYPRRAALAWDSPMAEERESGE